MDSTDRDCLIVRSYINDDLEVELVGITHHCDLVKISLSGSGDSYLYKEDIDKLITALTNLRQDMKAINII